ncbi:MAG: 2-amino-4-hydroxy-6-hydroxymethyldihydropteridine diphosphokinase [Chloroflexi bacterium]|nr:2-amino-4-hydroxy-6-hydroxymethyldihydropteridine diphosphokinase [Chloroflexota bacterium]MBI3340092.1 2-amino-4-hydroxy-6-hydroxymethyldihydropteridine diphosphokinase [Chloroflexota bacterium]
MPIIYLALGTNLGDRLANLRAAIDSFSPSIVHRQSSRVYETPPWGYTDQPAFLNMAVKCETDLDAESLLKRLKQIEVQVGREQSFRWGPRQIDIDILFYDDLVLESESLVIPHPRLHERAFVLVPLADIAPDYVHPVFKKTVTELLLKVDRTGIRHRL